MLKTLDTFQLSAVPSLHKAEVLELAHGSYIAQKENLILLGGAGTGKAHLVTALGVLACQQGKRVCFIGGDGTREPPAGSARSEPNDAAIE